MIAAASAQGRSLTATIGAGQNVVAASGSWQFSNSVSVSGGVGPFTYSWQFNTKIGGTWSFTNALLAAVQINVSSVIDQANAAVVCVVTDTATGKTATSNVASYGVLRSGS